MPGGLEYVKAKPYQQFKPNTEAFWKKPDLGKRAKRPPNEKQREGGGAPARKQREIGAGPAKGKGGAGDGRQFTGARATRQERTSSSSDVSRRGRGGQGDVEWGTPRMGQNPRQWAHAERVYPNAGALEGRRAIGAAPERRPHFGPDRTPLTGNRQFEALGPGHKPVTAADQRAANLAALVRDTPRQSPLTERNAKGMSIITGEIVPETSSTREVKAIGPRSADAHTTPIAKIRPARSGDTGALPRTEYTHDKTTELPKMGRQFSFGDAATVAASTARGAAKGVAKGRAVEAAAALAGPEAEAPVMTGFALRGAAKGAAQGVAKVAAKRAISDNLHAPKGIALTQHAEPLGQMSLFHEKGEGNLAIAKTRRTEQQSTVPPSLAAGRQLSLFHPAHFKMT